MPAPKILVIPGSLRSGSINARLAAVAAKEFVRADVEVTCISLADFPLPIYDGDLQARSGVPRSAINLKQMIGSHHGILIVTPEYNGSFPGVLKAMIDNTDIEKVWWGKKALLTGVSTGRAGNLRGMEHLTGVLQYLKMHVYHNKLPISVVNKLLNGEDYIGDMATLKSINDQLEEFIRF